MGQSYRIRTELGVNKTINVQLDQDFEFLEILSLKIQQTDIYSRSCSEYGVVVGRVTANNGFGIPNARVAVFIPVDSVDESNPIISSIYPYKSPNDKNEDGFRYNLLPYEKSYSVHAATGTLPNRNDVLIDNVAVEIYDKYYKYTTKTNESGDYMIMGVPVGSQTLVMDVDLSDIGEFSLTPQDLIRMGLATEGQVAGNRFKTSTDLSSLPQIITLTKTLSVAPLWGDPDICQIAINRVDYDLRDEANIDIQPTSVFMGSIYSTADSQRLRRNAKPKDNMGNLCELASGPGSILAIRQTINYDANGNPILELYQLEKSGNIIDGNGVWLTELPMNLDYFITNEFGEKVLSNDPSIGIPTKGKYRFKIKWSQSPSLSEQTRRAYFLVPNVKEYGWSSNNSDPTDNSKESDSWKRQHSSYYFGLDWSGYTEGFSQTTIKNNILNQKINCEDTFYQFEFNRVYTVSGFIDEFKNGAKGRFIGIKEIDNDDCSSTINKFPVNEGFRNFDLLFFIFSILLQVIQLIGLPLIIVYHFLAFLWNRFAVIILAYFIIQFLSNATFEFVLGFAAIAAATGSFGATLVMVAPFFGKGLLWTAISLFLALKFKQIVSYRFSRIKLPMITYPDCQSCECISEPTTPGGDDDTENPPSPGLLTQVSNSGLYVDNLVAYQESQVNVNYPPVPEDNQDYEGYISTAATTLAQSLSGRGDKIKNPKIFKTTESSIMTLPTQSNLFVTNFSIPPGERVNIFNTRKKYFDGVNKIKVTFSSPNNGSKYHYDNTLTVLTTQSLEPGTLLSFINPGRTKDSNYLWSGQTTIGGNVINGISGIIKDESFNARVYYANPSNQTGQLFEDYTIPAVTGDCVTNLTIKILESGTFTYETCPGGKVTIPVINPTDSPFTLSSFTNNDCINVTTLGGTADYTMINSGDTCQRYIYPSDIEYYQVLTAITITKTVVNGQPQYTIPELGNSTTSGIWQTLMAPNNLVSIRQFSFDDSIGYLPFKYQDYNNFIRLSNIQSAIQNYPTSNMGDFESQKITILQRGVDPYSPLLINKYGIGKILGHPNEDDVIITATTRMNIPIQMLSSSTNGNISVQNHKIQDNIYYPSYVYTPGLPGQTSSGFVFSSYTTPNVGYYGSLDSTNTSVVNAVGLTFNQSSYTQNLPLSPLIGVTSKSSNLLYSTTNSDLYGSSEDLSGGAILFKNPYVSATVCLDRSESLFNNNNCIDRIPCFAGPTTMVYFSPILYPKFTATTGTDSGLVISNSTKIVMRTDRLPSSDYIDNSNNLNGSVSLLQQNLAFAMYPIGSSAISSGSFNSSLGADIVTADIEGQIAVTNVLNTLGTCENMVGLNCYSGNGTNFGVSIGCEASDVVENGCYIMVNKPLTDLFKDLLTFAEWGFRFRFFYGLCRGVLSQSFMNNWVNGSLYAFPIQVDTIFNKLNQPEEPRFANQVVYFEKNTNNFYYRSSPYKLLSSNTTGIGDFIGRPINGLVSSVNKRNLLFPTTIINLGIKDDFYQEIIFDPSAKGYIMKSLVPTSYSDTSDLVNLFVISRITDEKFLGQIIALRDNSLQQLFSRDGSSRRIDADLAQSMSINSEYGVIPFSPEFYSVTGSINDPVQILGDLGNPTMAVFFSSTTQDLQNKDYLTPGVIDFRPSNNANAITYPYGIKSQEVPFYQWGIVDSSITYGVFGTQKNNWSTNVSDIFSRNYQSLDRRSIVTPSYMIPSIYPISDQFARGYLFNGSATTVDNLSYIANAGNWNKTTNQFLVGAPNHFYFGLIKGETALDKFKELYSIDE